MQNRKLLEWQEEQFLKHASAILNFGTLSNYSHKIELRTGVNVYLVSEEFYRTAISFFQQKEGSDDLEKQPNDINRGY
jgi:hypothetical protein